MTKANQQRWIELGITILLLVIAIVVSHVRLEGRVNLITATNNIEHKNIKDKLDAMTKKLDSHLERTTAVVVKEVAIVEDKCLKIQ